MKKIIAIAALLSCVVSSAYAINFIFPDAAGVVTFGTAGDAVKGSVPFKPSANVAMAYDGVLAAGVSYTVGSVHAQGSRVYGTSSVDTNIFYTDVTAPGIGTPGGNSGVTLVGATFPATIAATPSTYFGSGWTASK
jgi:hypothetical protein